MPTTLLSSFLSSNPTEAWVEHFEYTPEDLTEKTKKGKLYVLVSIENDSKKRTFISQALFSGLKQSYYSSVGSIEDLKRGFAEAFEMLGGGELLAVCFFESKIIGVAGGGATISLVRNGTYVTLVRSKSNEFSSVTGFMKSGDVFILGTHSFFEVVTKEMLIRSVSSRTPSFITEFLRPMIEIHTNGQIGAWFVKQQETIDHTAFLQNIQKEHMNESEGKAIHTSAQFFTKSPLYLKDHIPNTFVPHKKAPILLGVFLVLVLVVSIIVGTKKEAEREKENVFQTQIAIVQNKLDESQNLSKINPERSRQLFDEAKRELDQITVDPGSEKRINELRSKIESFQVEITGQRTLQLSLFVDLSLLSEGFNVNQIASSNGIIYVLDSTNQKIARISLTSKRAEVIAGPSVVGETKQIASYVDNLYGIERTSINRILPSNTVLSSAGENSLLFAYAGNLYVLDKNESQIYRYSGSSYTKQSWLTDGVKSDLFDSKSWIVDGTIWVLKENGEIKRFSGGNPYVFSLYGVYPEVKPENFYTDENTENLYVLDRINSRIVVATKGGEFITQYISDELKNARFIVADEEGKKVFIVNQDKVYVGEMGEQ